MSWRARKAAISSTGGLRHARIAHRKMKRRAKRPLGIVDFKNIRVLPSGYQVSIVRAKTEVSKHFAGHSEKSYRAAVRFRDKLLRELPDKRLNKIPRKLLNALQLTKPVVGVFRYPERKFYQVSYRDRGRQRSATFHWIKNEEVDAYRTAIEFRKLTLSRHG